MAILVPSRVNKYFFMVISSKKTLLICELPICELKPVSRETQGILVHSSLDWYTIAMQPQRKNSKAWNPTHSFAAFASCLYWKVPSLGLALVTADGTAKCAHGGPQRLVQTEVFGLCVIFRRHSGHSGPWLFGHAGWSCL